LVEQKYSP